MCCELFISSLLFSQDCTLLGFLEQQEVSEVTWLGPFLYTVAFSEATLSVRNSHATEISRALTILSLL